MTIVLPRNASLSSLMPKMREFKAENIVIDFKKFQFITPSGLSLLSSMIYDKEISIQNNNNINYLQRANFFNLNNIELPENFKRYDATDNMLELTKIENDQDPIRIDKKLNKILKQHLKDKDSLSLSIILAIYEMTDNILEHSKGTEFNTGDRKLEKPGFICVQYYAQKNNTIQVGISDLGIGIVESMQKAYEQLSREDILLKAFKYNSSRHIASMPKRGNGLAKLIEVVLLSEGNVTCLTNEFKIKFDNNNKDGIITKTGEDIIGTHFEIIIGCSKNISSLDIFNSESSDYDDIDDFLI